MDVITNPLLLTTIGSILLSLLVITELCWPERNYKIDLMQRSYLTTTPKDIGLAGMPKKRILIY